MRTEREGDEEKCNYKEPVKNNILGKHLLWPKKVPSFYFFKNTDPKIYLDTVENLKFKSKE